MKAENGLPQDRLLGEALEKRRLEQCTGCRSPELVLADERGPSAGWDKICPDTNNWNFFIR